MAECGDENSVKFFCCGGEGCNVLTNYFSMLPKFFSAAICCFKGTSIGNCLTCKGNVVADLQAVLMIQMWGVIIQVVATFAVVGTAIAGMDTTPQQEDQKTETLAALIPMMLFQAVLIAFLYSLTYYGVVQRNGLCCCIVCCWCMEGDLVMYLIGGLSIIGGICNLGKAIMTETDGDMVVKSVLFLTAVPVALFQLYTGVLVIKIAGLTEAERKQNLAESGDEEAPDDEEDYDYEN